MARGRGKGDSAARSNRNGANDTMTDNGWNYAHNYGGHADIDSLPQLNKRQREEYKTRGMTPWCAPQPAAGSAVHSKTSGDDIGITGVGRNADYVPFYGTRGYGSGPARYSAPTTPGKNPGNKG